MQTAWSDDRLDPEKATRAAARHLKDLYSQFGDWYLAMAAYNCGPGNVERAIQRTGYADFWELRARNVLPRETTAYVPIILAMTIIAKNPKAYELEGIEPEPALAYDVLPLRTATNLRLVADILQVPVAEVRELNPALLRDQAPTGYELRVPKNSAPQLLAALDRVPETKRLSWRLHRVSAGDTLAGIARQYGSSAAAIGNENPGAASMEAGEILLITVSSVQDSSGSRSRSKYALRASAKKKYGGRTATVASASRNSKNARGGSSRYQTAAASAKKKTAPAAAHRRASAARTKVAGLQAGGR
jgi:membrane-bound lytic murein transglycosylase D